MSSRAFLTLLACVSCLLLVNTALARNLYVNNLSGDDRHDGRAPIADTQDHGPFRTIDRAMRAARKGDHVVIANTGTPYRESITVQGGRNSGLVTRPFVIQGNGAVLDGSTDISADVWKPVQKALYRFVETDLKKQNRVNKEFTALTKGDKTALEFEPLWLRCKTEMERAGLGKNDRELFLIYLDKVGP